MHACIKAALQSRTATSLPATRSVVLSAPLDGSPPLFFSACLGVVQVMGTSILAAGSALLAAQLILLITDGARIEQIRKYARADPLTTDDELMDPQVRSLSCVHGHACAVAF